MSETEDWSCPGLRRPAALKKHVPGLVTFDRHELSVILRVYGHKVADGEWRDYAIDHLDDKAVFSIFRRSSEFPIYRVEKIPALARKQGQYHIVAASGAILKRGRDLAMALRILEKPRLKLVRC